MKRERERQTDRRRHRHCKGEKMSVWITSRVNWPAGKLATSKVFRFVVLVTFSPLSIYSFHLYGKGVWQSSNCFPPLVNSVNSWAQVRSQCSSA
jgi:hypothetical protein